MTWFVALLWAWLLGPTLYEATGGEDASYKYRSDA